VGLEAVTVEEVATQKRNKGTAAAQQRVPAPGAPVARFHHQMATIYEKKFFPKYFFPFSTILTILTILLSTILLE
jgi:hypothetical protein